jgi:hypothetical protein
MWFTQQRSAVRRVPGPWWTEVKPIKALQAKGCLPGSPLEGMASSVVVVARLGEQLLGLPCALADLVWGVRKAKPAPGRVGGGLERLGFTAAKSLTSRLANGDHALSGQVIGRPLPAAGRVAIRLPIRLKDVFGPGFDLKASGELRQGGPDPGIARGRIGSRPSPKPSRVPRQKAGLRSPRAQPTERMTPLRTRYGAGGTSRANRPTSGR